MIVVGGTYREICFEPKWDEIFGSGFRAVNLLLELDENLEIEYYTFGNDIIKKYLDQVAVIYKKFKYNIIESEEFTFFYDYPLREPFLHPWTLKRNNLDNTFNIKKNDDVLCFGTLESQTKLNGKKVVYDPQSPSNPISFAKNGSKAEKLIYVANFSEASKLSGSTDIMKIINYFFDVEKVFALIIKNGPKGATLYKNQKDKPISICCYKTENVWSIGSGDVFSAVFTYNWFKDNDIEKAVVQASKATALYCNYKTLIIKDLLKDFNFKELKTNNTPKGMVYLAGPFFTFSQRWLVNEIRSSLIQMKLNVFSPYHDVGIGTSKEIAIKDIEGLDKSSIVFALIDGLDSGTLFEVGYAISKGLKVLCLVQNETEESLTMLNGTNCYFEKDLSTAIYKTYWLLNENE